MKNLLLIIIFLFSHFSFSGENKVFFIVNRDNPVSKLSATQIADYFLKKNRTWEDGETVRFFDRLEGSLERKHFLSSILKRSSREIDSFWIGQKLFSGDSAPVQVDTDKMTINLVARFRGAISFVSSPPDESKSVKVIQIEDSIK